MSTDVPGWWNTPGGGGGGGGGGGEEGERRERGTNILEHSGDGAHIPMCDNCINYMYIHSILLVASSPGCLSHIKVGKGMLGWGEEKGEKQ